MPLQELPTGRNIRTDFQGMEGPPQATDPNVVAQVEDGMIEGLALFKTNPEQAIPYLQTVEQLQSAMTVSELAGGLVRKAQAVEPEQAPVEDEAEGMSEYTDLMRKNEE